MAAEKFTVSVVLKAFDKASPVATGLSSSLSRLGKSVTGLGQKFSKLNQSIAASGQKMQDVGKKMTTRLSLPIAALGGLAIKSSNDFNKAMANVASLIPGNIKRVKELKTGVQGLAIETGKATGDMAAGLYQVVSAFGDTSDTMGILRVNAKAAAAGLATTTDAINLTSAVTKGYGDVSEETVKTAADLAFTTVKLGQTTFPELAASIGRVVPLAAKLGVKQKELFTGFATLTGVTGSAAEVSTQMAAILRAMLKPTEDMKEAAKSLGFESASQMIKQKGVVETLKMLMKFTKGNEEATAALFGRAEALTAVFALTGGQADTYTKKLKEMEKASGAMETAFKEQTQGISRGAFAMQQLRVRLEVLAQKFGDAMAPAVEFVTEKLTKFTEWLDKLSPELKNIVLIVAGLAAVFGPLAIVLGIVAKNISILTTGFSLFFKFGGGIISILKFMTLGVIGLAKSFAGLIIAMGPIGIAIAALAAAAVLIIMNWDKVKTFFIKFWDGVVEVFNNSIELIKEKFWGLIDSILNIGRKISGFFKGLFGDEEKKVKIDMPDIKKAIGDVKIPAATQVQLATAMGKTPVSETIARMAEKDMTQTDINIKIKSAEDTEALVTDVRQKRGKANVKATSESFLGLTTPAPAM